MSLPPNPKCCEKRHCEIHTKGHAKKCCCDPNIKVAEAVIEALRQGNISLLLTYFALGGVVDFHGESASIDGIPIIPFAGTYAAADFFVRLSQYLTITAVGPVTDVEFSCYFDHVTLTVAITSTPRCSPTSPSGPTQTLSNLLKFTFNKECQITRVDIYTDTSGLALFYASCIS